MRGFSSRASFTLIELLVVVAIVTILAVVVVLTLNPAQLLKQARDSTRLSDLDTINHALNLYVVDVTAANLGATSSVSVSLPDSSGTCANLGLPALPSGYTYRCVTSANLKKVDGTGWIPVNFTQISAGAPFGALPVDPTNATTTGTYYTYLSGGSWALTSLLESDKYLKQSAANDGGYDPGRYEVGTDLSLIAKSEGLQGWWNFSEGAGATAVDSSGNGNNGTWNGTGVHYVSGGKVSSYAAQFDGTDDYISLPSNPSFYNTFASAWTIAMWANSATIGVGGINILFDKPYTSAVSPYYQIRMGTQLAGGVNNYGVEMLNTAGGYYLQSYNTANSATTGAWTFLVATFSPNNTTLTFYQNGTQVAQSTLPSGSYTNYSYGGALGRLLNEGAYWLNGKMDDVRIYNRAFSAAEIVAIYNATK